jgi:hypothetical protein
MSFTVDEARDFLTRGHVLSSVRARGRPLKYQ